MQFLYADGDNYSFMNMETYEQVELNKKQIENEVKYLKEGLEVIIIFFEGEMLGIELPEKKYHSRLQKQNQVLKEIPLLTQLKMQSLKLVC